MATVRVSRQFKEDFDTWAEDRISTGAWTREEIEGLKELFRKNELADGPDQLRYDGAKIDSAAERYTLWEAYFADKAAAIRQCYRRCA